MANILLPALRRSVDASPCSAWFIGRIYVLGPSKSNRPNPRIRNVISHPLTKPMQVQTLFRDSKSCWNLNRSWALYMTWILKSELSHTVLLQGGGELCGLGCVSPMHVYRARQASPTHFLVCVRPIQPWLGHTAAQSVRALSSKTKTDLTRDRSGQLTTATQSRQATASSQRVRSWIPLPVVSCAIIWSRRWRVLSSLARVGQSAIEQTLALVVVDGMDSCRVVVRSTSIGLWNFANCRTSMQIGNHWASYVENWDRSLHATDPAESPLAGSLQTDMSVSLTRPIDRLVCVDTGFHPHGF
jgi:hypothetical protein